MPQGSSLVDRNASGNEHVTHRFSGYLPVYLLVSVSFRIACVASIPSWSACETWACWGTSFLALMAKFLGECNACHPAGDEFALCRLGFHDGRYWAKSELPTRVIFAGFGRTFSGSLAAHFAICRCRSSLSERVTTAHYLRCEATVPCDAYHATGCITSMRLRLIRLSSRAAASASHRARWCCSRSI